jgi:hypothetical protein
MAYDDEDDYDVEDIELIDDEYELEPIPNPGMSKFSLAWIALDSAATLLKAFDHIIYNIKVDLVMRHNEVVDEEDFVGSVRAGIEKL